jgi:multimeric flavodoxin WrbA
MLCINMAKILIVYHSQSGNTEMLARSVAQGVVQTEHAHAIFKHASNVTAQDMRDCDAIVICSPEYFGYMAGAVKDLFDRTYEELRDDAAMYKKPYCVVISAGNDGSFACSHIERICKGYRLKMVQHPIVCKGRVTEEMLTKCVDLGMTVAEGINAGIF